MLFEVFSFGNYKANCIVKSSYTSYWNK